MLVVGSSLARAFGIVGAVDTIVVIEGRTQGVVFDVRGRDVEANELAVEFNKDTCRWTIIGAAQEVHRSNTRSKILAAICDSSTPVTPKDVTDWTGLSHVTVRQTMTRMAKNGEISHLDGGRYTMPNASHTS